MLEVVSQIACNDSTVYIHGGGTGKEVMARAIHLASARAEEPFVAINRAALRKRGWKVNCSAMKRGLTGAVKSSKGLLPRPRRTILLDEIGDMPRPSRQVCGSSGTLFYPLAANAPCSGCARHRSHQPQP